MSLTTIYAGARVALLQAQGIMPAAPVARGPSRALDAQNGRTDGKGKGRALASTSASVTEGSDLGGVDRKPVKAELEDTSIRVPPGVRGDVIVLSDDDDDDFGAGVGVVSVSRAHCTVVPECTVFGVANLNHTCDSRYGRSRSSATQTGEQLTTRTM